MYTFIALTTLFSLLISGLGLLTNDQTSEITELKRQVQNLQESVKNISAVLHAVQNGIIHTVRPVAFTACLTNSANLGVSQTIEFNHVITNEGNAYDKRHGVFRAPVSGLYHFSLTIYTPQSSSIHIQIVKDGTELIHLYSGYSDYFPSTTAVNVRLAAGQDVWCRDFADTSSITIYGYGYTCFSGHLITEMN